MNRKSDTITIFFVSILTIIIWFWAAGNTMEKSEYVTVIHFLLPEGSTSTVSPQTSSITLSLTGSQQAVENAKEALKFGIDFIVPATDGKLNLQDMSAKINELDVMSSIGVDVTSTVPPSFTLEVQSMTTVEAVVEVDIPSVTISGDVTVDPATVILNIPSSIRSTLPEAIIVTAVVSKAALEQLQPGVVVTREAVIHLPSPLDSSDVTIEPSRVSVTFKIQSKTQKTTVPQVRVLIASPAEDYAAYTVSLPRTVIPNVTIEADTAIIQKIESGDLTVFAVVRLASRELEQRIDHKNVTAFLAIMEDGTGIQVDATLDDPSLLHIELNIEPIALQPASP